MPAIHAKTRRTFVYESLYDAIDGTSEFRNRTMRTLRDSRPTPPFAYIFIGSDTIEDFKRDEGGRVQYGKYVGTTQCGVAFTYATKGDTRDDGKMIAEEARLIDVIENAILDMISTNKTMPPDGGTGGYTIQIDYVQPTTNQVIQVDAGGTSVEMSAVMLEVGWTQW
jgi:hypothetical protein